MLFVIVPAYEEAARIARVIATMPSEVDEVVVVDDASTDRTAELARAEGATVLRHERNRGVGAAIVTGYKYALAKGGSARDVFVVMAGDGQMDPRDLPALLAPIASGEADYVKGDRFRHPERLAMPRARRWGGRALSWATSRAIGHPISDSQCGYTAITREACARLDLDGLWPRYGYPNDLLSQLALRGLRIAEVPVRPVYAGEKSKLRPRHLWRIAWLVGRAWARRAWR
jgi:glycosyltransferase involved in cell wall biosynthesis